MTDEPIHGLIFDLDGTIAQSEGLHRISWDAPLAAIGVEIDDDIYATEFAGKPGLHIIRDYLGLDDDAALSLYDQVNAAYWQLAEQDLAHTAGLLPFLSATDHLPRAVCTSAQRPSAMRMLSLLGITDAFRAIISATEVTHGKPHPEPFLTAARAIGCEPARCLAFEDSANGLISARAAGMHTVGIGDGRSRFPDLADRWIDDFTDPELIRILAG